MGVSEWVAIAQRGMRSYGHVVCDSCGAEGLGAGEIAFCPNCEGIVGAEGGARQGGRPIEMVRRAVLGNDFDGASALYDQLIKDRPDPQLLYAKGLMRIEHSNYVVSQIDYGGPGFMERNAELRQQAALLLSEGKRLIMKSLSMSEAESKAAPNAYAFYRVFLCNLRMGNLRAAGESLKGIAELDKKGAVAPYAKVVLEVQGGLYGEAERELAKLARTRTPPANAFYYAAFVAFKTGDRGGAERIIRASGGLIDERKKSHLVAAMAAPGE
jgi:hypothetical protein